MQPNSDTAQSVECQKVDGDLRAPSGSIRGKNAHGVPVPRRSHCTARAQPAPEALRFSAGGHFPIRFLRACCALLGFGLLAGCTVPVFHDPARLGPFFAPTNYRGESSLGGIRRVVLLPVWAGSLAPVETAATLDPVFATALQQENRFEIVSLSRTESLRRFRAEAISSAAALPADLMATLRREFAADAVMFVDLTAYEAYRPMRLGLRAKLATLDGTRLLWTFDDLFSAEDPRVANSARHYFLTGDRKSVPVDLSPAALQSPSRFAGYAAAAMFATLPPVVPPPPSKSSRRTEPAR